MNRAALPLVLAFALAAGGLGYLFTKTPGPAPTPEAEDPTSPADIGPKATPAPAEPTSLASVDTSPTVAARAKTGENVDSWRIVPMNHLGQPWNDARITARSGREERTGTGAVEFANVPSGSWDVTIEVAGMPTWERRVELEGGRSRRTIAYVSEELRLTGRVLDTDGEPVGDEWVLFLPTGLVPTHVEAEAIRSSRQPSVLTNNGVLAVRAGKGSGRFAATLPAAGSYRIAVGMPDDTRWIQRRATDLTHGGPDHVEVRIPALASLELTYDGAPEEAPEMVTAYVFDDDLAQRLAAQEAERASSRDRGKVDKDQRRLRREERMRARDAAKERGESVGDDRELEDGDLDKLPKALGEQNEETYRRNMELYGDQREVQRGEARRAPPFEPGWRPIATGHFRDGMALVRDLPDNEGIHFLFTRRRERHTTPVTLRPEPGRPNRASLQVPPPVEGTSAVQTKDAFITLDRKKRPEDAERPEPGAHWTVGKP